MTDFGKRQLLKMGGSLALGALATNRASGATNALQIAINQYISDLRYGGQLAASERTAWGVYDLTAQRDVVFINGNSPMQAASLIKPFIVQQYLYANYRNGLRFPLTEEILADMRAIIVRSNNAKTTALMQRIGPPYLIERLLRDQAPSVYRNIQIVEYIPNNGQTYSNRASIGDYQRFLRAIWANKLVGSKTLKQLMAIKNNDRLKTGTHYLPLSARVYDKTGSTAMVCGNVGIIECDSPQGPRAYAISAIIESSYKVQSYGRWIASRGNIIRNVSDMTYLHFKNVYGLY